MSIFISTSLECLRFYRQLVFLYFTSTVNVWVSLWRSFFPKVFYRHYIFCTSTHTAAMEMRFMKMLDCFLSAGTFLKINQKAKIMLLCADKWSIPQCPDAPLGIITDVIYAKILIRWLHRHIYNGTKGEQKVIFSDISSWRMSLPPAHGAYNDDFLAY